MKPWKTFSGLSSWMIRLAVLLVVVSLFHRVILSLNFQSPAFLWAAGFSLSAVFLFVGGFFNRHGITMFAALALLILSAFHAWQAFNGLNDHFARYALLSAISVHYLANGNKT